MKKYLTTVAIMFFGFLIGFHTIIIIFLIGMWELDRLPSLWETFGFWSIMRVATLVILIVPIFEKFKIIKA